MGSKCSVGPVVQYSEMSSELDVEMAAQQCKDLAM